MQLSSIRSEVFIRSGISTSDSRVTDAQVTSAINAAIRRITLSNDWFWNVTVQSTTLSAAASSIVLAADHIKTLRVKAGEHSDLRGVTPRELSQWQSRDGFPRMYTVEAGNLEFAPTPTQDVAIEHVYLGTETALSGDTDQPNIPDEYSDIIIELACAYTFGRLRDYEAHNLHMMEYNTLMRRYQDDLRQMTALVLPKARIDTLYA